MRMSHAVIIGLAQAVALQPGVSRSGITITAARGLRFERERAARFSFLLSIPIIGGAGLYKGAKIVAGKEHIPHSLYSAFAAGVIASAVSGFLVIWALLAYLRRRNFAPFAIYRLAVAAFVFAIIASGVRPARVPHKATPATGTAISVHELVPEASHGQQVPGPVRVGFDLLPQSFDVDVQRLGVAHVVRAPDLVDQELPGQ